MDTWLHLVSSRMHLKVRLLKRGWRLQRDIMLVERKKSLENGFELVYALHLDVHAVDHLRLVSGSVCVIHVGVVAVKLSHFVWEHLGLTGRAQTDREQVARLVEALDLLAQQLELIFRSLLAKTVQWSESFLASFVFSLINTFAR